mmetsp:Transcript_31140/g.42836  ORF Transcript_31140/g.42836 Transcript_31140/m.42836 type:complete len:1326 (+) Transcript_31140:52-4029(+)
MLGLRPDTDSVASSMYKMVGNSSTGGPVGLKSNGKSYRFAGKLSGRFFVSGISGGFDKLKIQNLKSDTTEKPSNSFVQAPFLERRQREELKKEAQRLLEMEEKLQELQRRKELRAERERVRRARRLQYLSASKIQNAAKRFLRKKKAQAISVIFAFLRANAARQAVSTANWAIGVLRNFIRKKCTVYIRRKILQREALIAAEESWCLICDVAALYTYARRSKADEFVYKCIRQGITNVQQFLTANNKLSDISDESKSKRKKGQLKNDDYLQFFLTEFDNNGFEISDDDESDDDSNEHNGIKDENKPLHDKNPPTIATHSNDYVRKSIDGSKRKGSTFYRKNVTKHNTAAGPMTLLTSDTAVSKKGGKKYDVQNDEKAKRIQQMHQMKVEQMEQEKLRRAQTMELLKEKREKQAMESKREEALLAELKEQARIAFLQRMAEEQAIRAKLAAQLRENKLIAAKLKAAIDKKEQNERESMAKEDKVLLVKPIKRPVTAGPKRIKEAPQNEIPIQKPSLPPPKPRPPSATVPKLKSTESSTAASVLKKENEDLKRQTREAAEKEMEAAVAENWQKTRSDEAVKKCREAIRRRLQLKADRVAKKQAEEEEAENLKKMKIKQILLQAQIKLMKEADRKEKRLQAKKAYLKGKRQKQATTNGASIQNGVIGEANNEDSSDEDNVLEILECEHKEEIDADDDDLNDNRYTGGITSAHDLPSELIGNFQVEEFLSKSLQQLYVSDENGVPPPQHNDRIEAAQHKESSKNMAKKKKPKVKIPKFLENTPYFAAFSKLTDNFELEEKKPVSMKNDPKGTNNAALVSKEVNVNHANDFKVEVRDQEVAHQESFLDNNSRIGKVDSLMDMVSKARKKLGLQEPPPFTGGSTPLLSGQNVAIPTPGSRFNHLDIPISSNASHLLTASAFYRKTPPKLPLPPVAYNRPTTSTKNGKSKKKTTSQAPITVNNDRKSHVKENPNKPTQPSDGHNFVLKPPAIVSNKIASTKSKQETKKERYAEDYDDNWKAFESEYEKKLKEDYAKLKCQFSDMLVKASGEANLSKSIQLIGIDDQKANITKPLKSVSELPLKVSNLKVDTNGHNGDGTFSFTPSPAASTISPSDSIQQKNVQVENDVQESDAQRLSIKDLLAVWAMEDAQELLDTFDDVDNQDDEDDENGNKEKNVNMAVSGYRRDGDSVGSVVGECPTSARGANIKELSVFSEENEYNNLLHASIGGDDDDDEEEGEEEDSKVDDDTDFDQHTNNVNNSDDEKEDDEEDDEEDDDDEGEGYRNVHHHHQKHHISSNKAAPFMQLDSQSSQFDSHCEALMMKLATRLGRQG